MHNLKYMYLLNHRAGTGRDVQVVPVHDDHIKWSNVTSVPGIDICPILHQLLDDGGVAILDGKV